MIECDCVARGRRRCCRKELKSVPYDPVDSDEVSYNGAAQCMAVEDSQRSNKLDVQRSRISSFQVSYITVKIPSLLPVLSRSSIFSLT